MLSFDGFLGVFILLDEVTSLSLNVREIGC